MAAFGAAATRRLLRTGGPRILAAWKAGADHLAALLDTTALTTGNRVARSYLRSRRPVLAGINAESTKLAQALIARTISAGAGISLQRKLLGAMFTKWDKRRSLTVARTENATAWGTATQEQSKKDGVESHVWLTSRDDRVRPSHLIDGQCRALEEPFSIGLLYPLDPSGPAAEVINCRCTTAPRLQGCGEDRAWRTTAARAAEWRRQIAAQGPGERALRQWIRSQWRIQRRAFMAALPR